MIQHVRGRDCTGNFAQEAVVALAKFAQEAVVALGNFAQEIVVAPTKIRLAFPERLIGRGSFRASMATMT